MKKIILILLVIPILGFADISLSLSENVDETDVIDLDLSESEDPSQSGLEVIDEGEIPETDEDLTEDSRSWPHQPNNNVSASCRGLYGGNFFLPKTNVECLVYGRGVQGYEIRLNGNTYLQGRLDPFRNQQAFSSNKVQVGYNARYEVYLIDRFGRRNLVARGVAQHG